MTAFQEHWFRVAARFGLKVQIPFQVDLSGERLTVPVLLQEFGAERGMLLVTSYEDIVAVAEQAVAARRRRPPPPPRRPARPGSRRPPRRRHAPRLGVVR